PPVFQENVLRSAHAKRIQGRPGAALPPADFAAAARALTSSKPGTTDSTARRGRREDVLSSLLYPQVYAAFAEHRQHYDDTSTIPTRNFFYGLQPGEEISVEIERGKMLIIRSLTTGEARGDGTRTVFFELNGQPREVTVADR